jgi:hypothetical protein
MQDTRKIFFLPGIPEAKEAIEIKKQLKSQKKL